MLKSERILGAVYLPVHIFLLPLALAYTELLRYAALSGAAVNLIYYLLGFIFILLFLHRYLKADFHRLLDNPLGALKAVLLGYLLQSFLLTVVSVLLSFLVSASNPNTQEIVSQAKLDTNVMIFVAVLLSSAIYTRFRGPLLVL